MKPPGTLRTLASLGLRAWKGAPTRMDAFHRHDDIEINHVHTGGITYLFGPSMTTIGPGDFTLFWAALPHLLVELEPGTTMSWVTLPLAWAIQWRLPESFLQRLMTGHMVSHPADESLDRAMLERWVSDLADDDPERREIVTLELQARIRRAASAPVHSGSRRSRPVHVGHVERMAAYIARQYTQPIAVADIADHVDLHPNYAMTLFRQTCGIGLLEYITRHRVSHAQRLLATTDHNILNIAFAAGFGSLSRFYDAFNKTCGCTPRQYRVRMRQNS